MTWKSSDPSIVSIKPGDGNCRVTGEAEGGPVEITATAADGSGVSATREVTVVPATARKAKATKAK